MHALFLIIIATYLNYSLAEDQKNGSICADIKNTKWVGPGIEWLVPKEVESFNVRFYLSTDREKEPVQIDNRDSSQLDNRGFDTSKKTFIVTHGYMSSGTKPWVLDLKDALLEATGGNIIMVDWRDGCQMLNYPTAAVNTGFVAQRILELLQGIRIRAFHLKGSSDKVLWKKLHFIGHSLGSHISGQVAHLLKANSYFRSIFKVERITGLDPAQPCFSEVDRQWRIDREHADFVDIYHTQIGLTYLTGLGLTGPLGHVDFYLNGGLVQPECQDGYFSYESLFPVISVLSIAAGSKDEAKRMECSHKTAPEYFTTAIFNTLTELCEFPGLPWNGSYVDALIDIDSTMNDLKCDNCPKMGLNAVNSAMRGTFLVLTGAPGTEHDRGNYCDVGENDYKKIFSGLEKLKTVKSIFDLDPPEDSSFVKRVIEALTPWWWPSALG